MMNLRITNQTLTDGSKVYDVQFTTNDGTNIKLACTHESAAGYVYLELRDRVSYSEAVPS